MYINNLLNSVTFVLLLNKPIASYSLKGITIENSSFLKSFMNRDLMYKVFFLDK